MIIPHLQSCTGFFVNPSITNDPLIGKIYDTKNRKFIDFTTLINELTIWDVVYLSEKHDNPNHHDIQCKIIQELINKGKKPSIGFELFSMTDTSYLLNYRDSGRFSHKNKQEKIIENNLRINLGWDQQSDQMWAYYFNLLKLGRDHFLKMAGLDLSKPLQQRIVHKGFAHLDPIEKKQIFSTRLNSLSYKTRMEQLFKLTHCNMYNEENISRLFDSWKARNDKIALSITQLHEKNTLTVIIIGNGHTEYGLGVIDRVKSLAPDLSQVNLSIIEVAREQLDLAEYLSPLKFEGFSSSMPADYIWFTPRVSYEDPCLKFKKMFKKMKRCQS